MGQVKIKYLLRRRHKGQTRYYWSPKRVYMLSGIAVTCPFDIVRLGTDEYAAIDKARELNAQLEAWRKSNAVPYSSQEGSFAWVISKYREDERFLELRDSTKRLYSYYLRHIEDEWGEVPIKAMTPENARMYYFKYRGKQRDAEERVKMMRVLYGFARSIGYATDNPFEKLRVKKAAPRHQMLTSAEVEAMVDLATLKGEPSVALAIQLAYDLGQRPGDIITLTWNRFDGERFVLRQSKTAKLVDPRITARLKAMLQSTPRKGPLILTTSTKSRAFTVDTLSRQFRALATELGYDVQVRDLRRSAVVRMAEAGCTPIEVASVTGHSIATVNSILAVYCPTTTKMADNAMLKIERGKD
jgi:integrase